MNQEKELYHRINHLITRSQLTAPLEVFEGLDFPEEKLQNICDNIFELKYIKDLIRQGQWNEILLFGPTLCHIERNQEIEIINLHYLSEEEYHLALEVLAIKSDVFWNTKNPFVSFYCELDSIKMRCSLIHKDITSDSRGRCFLRKISDHSLEIKNFNINEQMISDFVIQRKNILISGETGSGKTSLMRSFIQKFDPKDHVLIIEDTREIIPTRESHTTLISDDHIEMESLLTYGLRLRPNRIVVGEIRSKEALTYLMAMNTGHSGVLSTIHANGAKDALVRLALLISLYSPIDQIPFSTLLEMICKNIDIVIHLKHRVVQEIIEIHGCDGKNPFYETLFTKE